MTRCDGIPPSPPLQRPLTHGPDEIDIARKLSPPRCRGETLPRTPPSLAGCADAPSLANRGHLQRNTDGRTRGRPPVIGRGGDVPPTSRTGWSLDAAGGIPGPYPAAQAFSPVFPGRKTAR